MVQGFTGLTDEQIAKLHPGLEKLFNATSLTIRIQTIAEVVRSDRCFAQVKKGDK